MQQKIPTASVLTCISSEMVGQLLLSIEVLLGLFKLRNMQTCEISCFSAAFMTQFPFCYSSSVFTRDTQNGGA